MAHRPVELLAPAGTPEALHAALAAGADAVYLGLESFNARRNAGNFTTEALRDACAYAHLRGARVYVALNTVILPDEVDDALECARQAYRAGADAFIVQDIGLAAELTRTLPEARLHVSTQMNTVNAAGIRAAARLGASRVTLGREVSLGEVAALVDEAAALDMEVETFAHGALCVCYSGQCLMSSLIGGRSANRGLCAQACRLPYELGCASQRKPLDAPGEHLLSPQDLCAIDLLGSLVQAGVASLKIEGRMKSPEYVAGVVSVYRAVLDRVLAAQAAGEDPSAVTATEDERTRLAEAFSRGFTTAYLEGERGNDMMSYQRPNNRGVPVGRVAEVRDGAALLKPTLPLAAGDVVEFWTKKGHGAVTLAAAEPGRGGLVRIPLDRVRGVKAGDRVFRVRSAQAAFQDDALAPRVPVRGVVDLRVGRPLRVAFTLAGPDDVPAGPASLGTRAAARRLAARFAGAFPEGAATGPQVEPARTRAVTADDVRAHVDRLGTTPFTLVGLDVRLDEGAGIGFSQLHHARAEALDDLASALLAGTRDRPLPRVEPRVPLPEAHAAGCLVAAWATNPACARAARRAGAELIFVPALNYRRGEASIAGQLSATAEQAGYPKQCAVALPVADHDPVGLSREAQVDLDVWRYVDEGRPVLADSLAAMERAQEEGAVVEVGPHVPIANDLSLDVAAAFGARRVWLSPELTLRQIEELGRRRPVALGLTVIGAQELMVTEHCLLMSQGPCNEECATCPRRKSPHYLKDRKGFEFPVITDALGRSHLYNSVELDVAAS
ncbi:MAG: U32 family peptidase, partial [Eggerthellaceae bacterium]|nr:U32 family peptidase [Eggerthellaceae bacterium]